ncbi:glycosyl hydrolase 2 galactose-binding domain-containing protein [Hydrogenophaga soli]
MIRLDHGWTLCETPANAWDLPPLGGTGTDAHADTQREAPSWWPATVPGTAASDLAAAGQYLASQPRPLHDHDLWYRHNLTGHGPHHLRFEGLATVAEVFLDGVRLARHTHMFAPLELPVTLHGNHTLHLVFRSLGQHLQTLKPPRARWRVAMAEPAQLRAIRTTLIGHLPSWCPPVDVVGPWQPVTLVQPDDVTDVRLAAQLDGDTGHLRVHLRSARALHGWQVHCHGQHAPLVAAAVADDPAARPLWQAQLTLPTPPRWWPLGYGPAILLDVTLCPPDTPASPAPTAPTGPDTPAPPLLRPMGLGRVGFRDVTVDRQADGKGFQLRVNGVAVFARGAVFTPAHLLDPAHDAANQAQLHTLAHLGVNMVRLPGPLSYMGPGFFDTCDTLGLMVWQDLMLANFDYPWADPGFAADLLQELDAQVATRAGHPSLVVVCGGSEIHQQAAMLGLPEAKRRIPFLEDTLPAWCATHCPGRVVLPSTPWGGALPFSVREGVSHCFGVGAYERDLGDARRTAPRFAAECLALAHVPEPVSLHALGVPAVHHPDWKAGVPRDRHASWDFEDTRDHYLQRLFQVDPQALRRTDAQRYLALSRAVSAHVLHQTLAEWRHPGSPTAGALVFTSTDLRTGAGWGLLAVDGEPKAAAQGFAQAAQPLALLLTDEGNDGLDIHLVNDHPHAHAFTLHVALLRQGRQPVAEGSLPVQVPAHGHLSLNATEVLGAFADVTYAYRFGPPAHDAVVVTATPEASEPSEPLQAVHFPLGLNTDRTELGLSAHLVSTPQGWCLELSTTTLARFVHIQDDSHRPRHNHFHLVPGHPRRVPLHPRPGSTPTPPQGTVHALNGLQAVAYGGAP